MMRKNWTEKKKDRSVYLESSWKKFESLVVGGSGV